MSDSHESQDARPSCPSPTPGVHSNSCPSSQWWHPAISSSGVPFSSCPQSLPAWVFSNESTLCMRWPKYWSFSFSIIPSKEHPGLISFRMDYLDLLEVVLCWCKSNCGFALLKFAVWYWNTFLNKCAYVIHYFNAHFSLYVLLLMTYYLLFILYLF